MFRDRASTQPFHFSARAGIVWSLATCGCILSVSAHAAGSPVPSEPLITPSISAAPLKASPADTIELQRPPENTSPLHRMEIEDLNVMQELQALKRNAAVNPGRTQSKGAPGQLDPGTAAWTLGLIYLHGAGIPQDLGLAQTWFERAVKLRENQAMAGLAWCAIEGCRTPTNAAEADRWIASYKRINKARALYLEWLALDRRAPLRTPTPDLTGSDGTGQLRNRALLTAAARGGDVHALIELGMDAVTRGEPAQALRYFEAAAPKSQIAASNAAIVAESMQTKEPQQSDANKLAEELLTEAQRLHRGEGQAANYVEAIRLYRMAADKGSAEAKRMLALIYSKPLVNGSFDVQWISQLSELDLSRSMPGLRTKTAPRQLQRERTPLVDLLPAKWRARIL
jgi:uncharacterized protein